MKYFSLLDESSISPTSETKIIPKKEFEMLLSGKELIEEAHKQFEEFEIELETERKTALERGYKDGYQEGLTEFNEHILQLDAKLKSLRIDMQNQVLSFALKAAKKIVGDVLTLQPEVIMDIVKQTLKPVREAQNIKIGVSKEDRPLVEKRKGELKEILEQVETLVIEERSDVTSGGCIIETETGIINATLENQWRALEAAFTRMAKR